MARKRPGVPVATLAVLATSCAGVNGAKPRIESFTIRPVTLVFRARREGTSKSKHATRPSPFLAQQNDGGEDYGYEWEDDPLCAPGPCESCAASDDDCQISSTLELHKRFFGECLERAGKRPDATVTLTMHATLRQDGAVTEANARDVSPSGVGSCVEDAFRQVPFVSSWGAKTELVVPMRLAWAK